MKKILATVLGVVFAMFAFAGCNMAAADGTATGASGITSIVMMVVIIAVFYFLMIVPKRSARRKRRRCVTASKSATRSSPSAAWSARSSTSPATSSPSRPAKTASAIEITKWAVSSNEGKGANKETSDSEESLGN